MKKCAVNGCDKKTYAKQWCAYHYVKQYNAKYRQHYKNYRKRLKEKILAHYGNKCACCGETEPKFLTIDHINEDGHLFKRKNGRRKSGADMYIQIIKDGFPTDLQILCFNCNLAKGFYGICPHKLNNTKEMLAV